MMAAIGRNAVRFKDTPTFVRVSDDVSMSSADSNTTLMKALQMDESSSVHSELLNDKSIASDSPTERMQWVGRTPHAKVLDAKRSRKALDDLMKMPDLAPLNNSISIMMATPFVDSSAMQNDNDGTPSDISFSPAGVAVNERSHIAGTPYVQPVKGKNVFLDTPYCPSEAPNSLARSTPSSNSSYSFDLLSTEADRILSSMPNSTPMSDRSTHNYISPLSEPSIAHPRLSSANHTPAQIGSEQISFADEEPSTTKKIVVKSAVKPLRTVNQNSAAFERPKQILEDSTLKTVKSATKIVDTPMTITADKENQLSLNKFEKKVISEVKVQVEQTAPAQVQAPSSLMSSNAIVVSDTKSQSLEIKDNMKSIAPAKALFQEMIPKPVMEETMTKQVHIHQASYVDETSRKFASSANSVLSMNAMSDVHFYSAPVMLEVKPKLAKSVAMNVDLPQTNNRPPEFISVGSNDEIDFQRQRHQELKQEKLMNATTTVKVDQGIAGIQAYPIGSFPSRPCRP